MKSRIIRAKKALLWGCRAGEEPARTTLQICQRLGISCLLPPLEGWEQPIQQLLNTPGGEGCSRPERLLLLAGLSDQELEELLSQLRQAKALWPMKAVLTPHNSRWSLKALWEELVRERAALSPAPKQE